MGLEVVQVDAFAVNGVVDAVSQAVGEVVTVAGLGDVSSGYVIDLPALNGVAAGISILEEGQRSVPGA